VTSLQVPISTLFHLLLLITEFRNRNTYVLPLVISPGDIRRLAGNPLVKVLGKTGFQFRLLLCDLRISEIKLT